MVIGLILISLVVVAVYVSMLLNTAPSKCTGMCNQGRNCTCCDK